MTSASWLTRLLHIINERTPIFDLVFLQRPPFPFCPCQSRHKKDRASRPTSVSVHLLLTLPTRPFCTFRTDSDGSKRGVRGVTPPPPPPLIGLFFCLLVYENSRGLGPLTHPHPLKNSCPELPPPPPSKNS